ncbi:hypothetical protein [Mucilaginibacter sp.]|uniref:hypothetical protein n=1 Tax=Mucilaginibacter sp. TaxID=1882438 RepID=UPI0035BBC7D8
MRSNTRTGQRRNCIAGTTHKTESGKLDKRYNANKHLKKDGTMDMRYKSSKSAAGKMKKDRTKKRP